MTIQRNRVVLSCARGAVVALLLAGCGDPAAYVDLQNAMKTRITKLDRPVSSVACTPHVKTVEYHDGLVDLRCRVRFKDGSAYEPNATIEARSFSVQGYRFSWDGPPPVDITRQTFPKPAAQIAGDRSQSLFEKRNLGRVTKALRDHFGAKDYILGLVLYPGELEAIVGRDGDAQLVTALPTGTLSIGPTSTFDGKRTAIEIGQLRAGVPERLVAGVARKADLPRTAVERLDLAFLPDDLAGWEITTANRGPHFRAHLQGDDLRRTG